MEDIYGPNDGVMHAGEDINHNGVLEADYDSAANNFCGEGARYGIGIETDLAAVSDHKYFRRGVRLINGQTLFGAINKGYSALSEYILAIAALRAIPNTSKHQVFEFAF